MPRLGMDADEVERVATQLNNQANSLGQAISQINGLVNQATQVWDGNDSRQFHDWWNNTHKPNLEKAKHALEDLGKSAKQNAEEQRRISG